MSGREVELKSPEDIEHIRKSALILSKTLAEVGKLVKPGVTPEFLDQIAEEFIKDHGGIPAFKGHHGFPSTLCISINEAVVHGIPHKNITELKEGDIVTLDGGVLLEGYYSDSAYTFAVGDISEKHQQLLSVTKECLQKGIEQAVAGNRIGDIGYAVQEHAEKHGYGVVRELVGHGVGKAVWEKPEVPNYGKRGTGARLEENLVIAIEPMINAGKAAVKWLKDGWTVVTSDSAYSAHFEHTVLVKKGEAEVLTSFDFIEEALLKTNK